GLTALQGRFRFTKIGTEDLREGLQTASGKDLTAYFREWLYGTALPEIEYRERVQPAAGGFHTSVDVRARNLPGPVPLALSVAYPGGRATRTVVLPPEGGTFVLETPKKPGKVDVNGDRGLLARIKRQ